MLKFSFTYLSETRLGARLEQSKLGFGQYHLLTDNFLALLIKVETREDFPIAFRKAPEDVEHELDLLAERRALFRIIAPIRDPYTQVQVQLIAPAVNSIVNIRSYLAAYHGSYETHQAVRLPQFSTPDGLDHDDKSVVNLIIQFLVPQLPAQIITDAAAEQPVKLLHAGFIAAMYAFHQILPVDWVGYCFERLRFPDFEAG